ncbi:hypothetical protein SPBRAN_435 [uncultured Candidatus Thioglobus sp.]|nr:hypothetical protein SPBRAN_435 [uncultured Candidatus Thioglobus sp.]
MLDIFEKKNNTVAFVLLTIAATFWGLFGLISAFASDITTSPLFFTTVGTFFSLLSTFIACFLLKVDVKEILREIKANKRLLKFVIIRTIAGFNSLALVVGFFFLSNKIIGLLIFESAPMLSILFSYYILKNELSNETGILYSWFLIICSFIGVVILSLEVNSYSEGFVLKNNVELLGLGVVFIGLLGSVLVRTLNAKITLFMKEINPEKSKLEYALGTQLITNFFLFTAMALISFYFYSPAEINNFINADFLLLAMFFGIFVEFLPTAISKLAGAIATSHNIFMTWFLTPIIGVILLWYFDYGEINSVIMLSFVLILVPNILLNMNIEDSFSFKVTFIWILLFAIILFYSQGNPIDSETYFNSTNALLVFFALMVGYLITKLNERGAFREQLFMRFLHKLRAEGVSEEQVESLSGKFQQANNRLTDQVEIKLAELKIETSAYSELLDFKFIQNRRLYNAGELFVLLLVSLLLIGITTLYRDNNFLYDSYAFIINTAVIFTLAQVVERMFFSEYQTHKTSKNNITESIVAMAFLTILIMAIIALFLSKYGFVI